MTPLELQAAWEKLLAFSDTIETPKGFWDKTYAAYGAWGDRLNTAFEIAKGSNPFIPLSEMELWMKSYGDHKVFADQAAVKYPKITPKVTVPTKPVVVLPELRIEGSLPWYYWPLRVGAGVGAGYFLYKTLTPTEKEPVYSRRRALAGR